MSFSEQDQYWLSYALQLASKAALQNEIPVGAVIVFENEIIGEGWNRSIAMNDPTSHAEVLALRAAGERLQNYRLLETTMYVTLEPCAMCAGALIQARVKHLVYGASDPKAGAVKSILNLLDNPHLNHRVTWQGDLLTKECASLLQDFFKQRRK